MRADSLWLVFRAVRSARGCTVQEQDRSSVIRSCPWQDAQRLLPSPSSVPGRGGRTFRVCSAERCARAFPGAAERSDLYIDRHEPVAGKRQFRPDPMQDQVHDDDRYTDDDIETGAILLAQIRDKLAAEGLCASVLPPMRHTLGYMRADNIRAVIVQQRNGGWVVDALFQDVPPGCPESYGTADANPFGTRRAACKAAVELVRDLTTRPVPAETVAWMLAGMPDCGPPMLIGDEIIFATYRL